MPHHDDFAIVLVKFAKRTEKPTFQFPANRSGGGREFLVFETGKPIEVRAIRISTGDHRFFPVDRSALSTPMPTVHVDDAIFRQLPEPKVKRHGTIADEVVEPCVRLDQYVLHDITGIHTTRQSPVKSQLHHTTQRLPMPFHQMIDGMRIALAGLSEQILICSRSSWSGF